MTLLLNQHLARTSMSTVVVNKKRKLAKYIGSIYFIGLGLVNVIGTAIYSNNLGYKDLIVLALFCTPLLVNKKFYYFIFGAISSLLWGYLLFAVFQMHVKHVRGIDPHTNPYMSAATAFTIGYSFCAVSLICSLLIVYAGMSDPEQKAVT